ncbi:uncharacterized protein LOC119311537 [Triticum dicoccoides]|uniref:uncharacterized protein LOC119311537 n=1 Tax=Triticum dicoccoides TaxID=85692 RepID=UPI00189198B3|nr:uncharacterized protein LOC119311537 [Triticum dicoccoides]
MVAPCSSSPQCRIRPRKWPRRMRARRRGTRTSLLFPAPSSNPVAEVTEAVLELGMLAGDAGVLPPPDAVAVAAAAMSLSTLSRARPSPGRQRSMHLWSSSSVQYSLGGGVF